MAKIGIDIRMLGKSNGGIGRYVLELVKNILSQDGTNNYLLFFNPKNSAAEDVKIFEGFKNAVLVPAKFRHYSLGEQVSFLRMLNFHELDLVHFPNFNVPIFYKRPFVVTIHDLVHHKISGAKKSRLIQFFAYKKVIQTAADNARKVITVSENSKIDIVKYLNINPNKVSVIYEGSSLSGEVPVNKIEEVKNKYLLRKPYLFFVGVLERKKNLVNLTRGFDVLVKKYRVDMDLVIAGKADKHYPDIKHQAMDIKFHDHLVFTGQVDDTDLAALYGGAFAFVSASLHEGFGLPGVEAMKFGLPLAVSNTQVFNEIYDNAAIYFNPLDPSDIAEKLDLLARDGQFYSQLREKSFLRGQQYDWKMTALETLKVYQECLMIK